jgi:hypothetical protein
MKKLNDTDEIKNTSDFIGFVDLLGAGNVKVTIQDVFDVSGDKLDGMREAKLGTYAIVFKERPNRSMIIQGKKKKFLMIKFGKKKSDWIGKQIEIYADPNVKLKGETVGGLKIVGMEKAIPKDEAST